MSNVNKEFRNDLTPRPDDKHQFSEQTKFLEKMDLNQAKEWVKTVFQPDPSFLDSLQATFDTSKGNSDTWFRLWPVGYCHFLLEMGVGHDLVKAEWFLIENSSEKNNRHERTVYQVSGPGFELPALTRGQYSYPNPGNGKVNNIAAENLGTHIAYNLIMRPGRSFLLNGEIVYKGIGYNAEECEKFAEDYKNNPPEMHRATIPYC